MKNARKTKARDGQAGPAALTPPAKKKAAAVRLYGLLPLRDTVIFPGMVMPLFVGRPRSIAALELAMQGERKLVLVAQKRVEVDDPEPGDIHRVGTMAEVLQLAKLPDGSLKVLVEGQSRCRIRSNYFKDEVITCSVTTLHVPKTGGKQCLAAMRQVSGQFEQYVKINPKVPQEVLLSVQSIADPGILADTVAAHMPVKVDARQQVLATVDPVKRLLKLSRILADEVEIMELEQKIRGEVRGQMEKSQREYYLHEQLKIIQRELGGEDGMDEADELEASISNAEMPEEVADRAYKELGRYRSMPQMAPEASIVRTYLDWLTSLPWRKLTTDRLDLDEAARILDEDHYGLSKVKERVLEYMAVRSLAGDTTRAPILCFVGPPGVGKTSMGRSIARAMGRNFIRVSLGGVRDEAEIRGHRRTYVGALPGRILQSMRRAASLNPVFVLDEIDKMSADFRGDPASALLEVLDPEQNQAFSDHYLEVDYDLSKVMFVMTANTVDPIPPALLDRMELIEIPSYTEEEKFYIATRFLIPKQMELHGLLGRRVQFGDDAVHQVIRQHTREAGVRNLERQLATLCRKTARQLAQNLGKSQGKSLGKRSDAKSDGVRITPRLVTKHLGQPRLRRNEREKINGVGVATGLAWTESGGDILPTEAAVLEGSGVLTLTGKLGEVMQESAKAALSFARRRVKELDLAPDFHKTKDIHIHLPEGAIPKDGPSAGITMAAAIISALTGRPVLDSLAMTGEITLRGRVMAVGGLKEKLIAAHRAGLKTVILPKENEKDLEDVPKSVKSALKLVFVTTMDDVLKAALKQG